MRRVLVLGCPGAGKTTFSRQLAALTGLPLVSLDREFWLPGWRTPGRQQWRRRVVELCAADDWIQDGNYDSSLDLRLPRADTAVILDHPLILCLARIAWRTVASYGRVRQEMAVGCPERFDFGFLAYTSNFNRRDRVNIDRQLASHGGHISPVIIRHDGDIARLLDSLRTLQTRET